MKSCCDMSPRQVQLWGDLLYMPLAMRSCRGANQDLVVTANKLQMLGAMYVFRLSGGSRGQSELS